MPLSSKFLTKFTGKNTVNIGQYLAKIWTKCNSLLFGPPCRRSLRAYKRNAAES